MASNERPYQMKYFKMEEFYTSPTAFQHGINNLPGAYAQRNIRLLVQHILDPLRARYGAPIIITSGYRNPLLNELVGGSAVSDHLKGLAADFRSKSDSRTENERLFKLLLTLMRERNLPIKQLIDEHNYDWIHVSLDLISSPFVAPNPHSRQQVLHY